MVIPLIFPKVPQSSLGMFDHDLVIPAGRLCFGSLSGSAGQFEENHGNDEPMPTPQEISPENKGLIKGNQWLIVP